MNFDLFFSSPRWKILETIAERPSSPLEISRKLNTSVAYISQQIKLLEAASLVKKEKTGSVEKGKPRTVFSLAKEILPLTVLMNKFPVKKLIQLTDYHKIVLRIWLLENVDLHYLVEKFYWEIENELADIAGIFIILSLKKPKMLIISDSKKVKNKTDSFSKKTDKLDFLIAGIPDLKKFSLEEIHPIYDPRFLILKEEVKGGKDK